MRKSVLLLMSFMLVSLTGCDFIRAVAGRPTSRDIEAGRIAIIKAEEEALQHRLDSIRIAERKIVDDSLSALGELASAGVLMSGPRRLGGLSDPDLNFRYCIVIGAFRSSGNAGKLFDTAYGKGYSPVLIGCRNGMTVVGVCPSDRIASVWDSYGRLKDEPFFPKEAWILVNE